jgi:hypothetical protein
MDEPDDDHSMAESFWIRFLVIAWMRHQLGDGYPAWVLLHSMRSVLVSGEWHVATFVANGCGMRPFCELVDCMWPFCALVVSLVFFSRRPLMLRGSRDVAGGKFFCIGDD